MQFQRRDIKVCQLETEFTLKAKKKKKKKKKRIKGTKLQLSLEIFSLERRKI